MTKRVDIKVGFCVSYDWELLKISLPLIYNYADIICLSMDVNRKSWSGLNYAIDEGAFNAFVSSIDTKKKIDLYEDDFSIPDLSAIENDNRQRNMMADRMGQGGWHVQIDCDEYFIDFQGFCEFLKRRNINSKEINYSVFFYPIIKKVKGGFLTVKFHNNHETVPVATNKPNYEGARRNGYFNFITPYIVIHETWSRDEEDLLQKLNSWGHINDFNKESFYNLWKAIDEKNYKYLTNFHPLNSESWPALQFIFAKNIQDLIAYYKEKPPNISYNSLRIINSRLLSKIKLLLK